VRQISKWFYDTSTGATTGAVCCGSFIRESFSLLVARCGWTRWTQRFMWFESPERNTLRQRENWVVLLNPALPGAAFFVRPVKRSLSELFIAQGRVVTLRPGAWQMVPWWLKLYTTSRVIIDRSTKWCLVRCLQHVVILSYRSAALNMARPVMPSYRVTSLL
jgi:hypothetical protein